MKCAAWLLAAVLAAGAVDGSAEEALTLPQVQIRHFAAQPRPDLDRSWSSFELSSTTTPSFVYRLHLPPNGAPKALLIYLSGSGRGGYDNLVQMRVPKFLALFDRPEFQDIAVVLPQSPGDAAWDSLEWLGPAPPRASAQPVPLMLSLVALATELARQYHLAPSQLVLMGHSMGAFGTLDAAGHFPGLFGHFVSLAGGGDPAVLAAAMTSGQLWLFHGDADSNVPVEHSRRIAAALTAAGKEVHLVVLHGSSHGILDEVVAREDFQGLLKSLVGDD